MQSRQNNTNSVLQRADVPLRRMKFKRFYFASSFSFKVQGNNVATVALFQPCQLSLRTVRNDKIGSSGSDCRLRNYFPIVGSNKVQPLLVITSIYEDFSSTFGSRLVLWWRAKYIYFCQYVPFESTFLSWTNIFLIPVASGGFLQTT